MKLLFTIGLAGVIGCAGSTTSMYDETPSTLVATQRMVVEKKQPILYVVHDKDGEWAFLADERSIIDPVVELSIQDIIAIDSTVLQVADLKKGWKASRASRGSPWVATEYHW
ncbi:MAG TPA: hypothetical protein VEO56_13835 [Bacteroidota bacterium]|nr:hypothetical protein [Bacteroidota bacterium]